MNEERTNNHLFDCQSPHAEVIELATRTVWQSFEPMSRDDLARLLLPEGISPVGVGRGMMDAHYFRRSPGATPGVVNEKTIAGRRFFHCANPAAGGPQQPIPNGPARLVVDKHHSIVFEAGRELNIIRTDIGTELIQVISASPQGGGLLQASAVESVGLELPAGWQLRSEHVAERTVIDLPNPTEAWFFPDGSSFQGPITLFT